MEGSYWIAQPEKPLLQRIALRLLTVALYAVNLAILLGIIYLIVRFFLPRTH